MCHLLVVVFPIELVFQSLIKNAANININQG